MIELLIHYIYIGNDERSHWHTLIHNYTYYRYVDELLYWSGNRLTLDECLGEDLSPRRLPPAWVTPDKFVYQADDGSLALLDTSNNSVALLVSNHTLVCCIYLATAIKKFNYVL